MTRNIDSNSSWGPTENAYLRGNYAPIFTEDNFEDLPVQGKIPEALNGKCLIRTGPNPHFQPREMEYYHWFDGDGMLNAFYFHNGRVSFRNKFLHTKRFILESAAGEALYGGIRTVAWHTAFSGWFKLDFGILELIEMALRTIFGFGPSPSEYKRISTILDSGNTSIKKIAGKVLALDEAGGPYELDPITLNTIGPVDYGGKLQGAMIAHPLVDPITGETFTIGYDCVPPYLIYYIIDRHGEISHTVPITLPYPAMIHSFSLTEKYVVFYHLPATFFREDMGTVDPILWDPTFPSRIGIMPRYGIEAELKWFDIAPSWMFHTVNAFERGDEIIIDLAKYPRIPLLDLDTSNPSPPLSDDPVSALVRWFFNYKTGVVREEMIVDHPTEFTSCDPRIIGREHTHGFCAIMKDDIQVKGLYNTIVHFDYSKGTADMYTPGAGRYYVGEPCFITKSDISSEGDGYLLSVAYDDQLKQSELLIFEALSVSSGPIASAKVGRRIPYDFHGNVIF